MSRWESEIRAFELGARILPYALGNGMVLMPGNRKAIQDYLRTVPAYVNQAPYPLVIRSW